MRLQSLSILSSTLLLTTALMSQAGQVSTFGTGCKGTNGVPQLSFSGTPAIGQLLSVHINKAQAFSPGTLWGGVSNKVGMGLPLPLKFGQRCYLLVSPNYPISFYTSSTGTHTYTTRIPNQIRLVGTTLYGQAIIDDKASDIGKTMSNGGKLVIGVQPVLTPASLKATEIRKGSLVLTWSNRANNANKLLLFRAKGSGDFKPLATLGANVTSYKANNLTPCANYRFVIYAANARVTSKPSNICYATPTPLKPAAPSNLRATKVLARIIELAWKDNNPEELGFQVFHSPDGKTFRLLATTGRDKNSLRVTGATPNAPHWFKVRVLRSCGVVSDFSNTVWVKTEEAKPATPTKLKVTAIRRQQVDLTWQDNATNEVAYHVATSKDGKNWNNRGKLPAGATAFTVKDLDRKTTYWLKVRCVNASGAFSDYSNIVKATTR